MGLSLFSASSAQGENKLLFSYAEVAIFDLPPPRTNPPFCQVFLVSSYGRIPSPLLGTGLLVTSGVSHFLCLNDKKVNGHATSARNLLKNSQCIRLSFSPSLMRSNFLKHDKECPMSPPIRRLMCNNGPRHHVFVSTNQTHVEWILNFTRRRSRILSSSEKECCGYSYPSKTLQFQINFFARPCHMYCTKHVPDMSQLMLFERFK